ncbi:hypothetical protein WA158_004403 [Blastocystis sp. Blastoise]
MNFLLLTFIIALVLSEECTSSQLSVTLRRTYMSDATQEGIQIWQGNYQTGRKIGEWDGNGKDNTVQTYSLCLTSTLHTVVAIDGAKNGWTDGSIFEIVTRSGIVILKGTLDNYQMKQFTFYPAFTIKSTDSWKYSTTSQSDNQWTASGYSDSTWTSYAPGSFPAVASITRYFRATATVPTDKTSFAVIDAGVFTKDGVAIYINGQEVYRRNLATSATGSTPATSIDANAGYRRITIPVSSSFITGSTITMAVELHAQSAATATEDFVGVLIFVYGPSVSRNIDFTANAERAADYSPEPVSQAFDGDIQTKWYASSLPIWGEMQFNNGRKEWINRYTITVGNYDVNRRPTSWKIFGSNDGSTYTLLDSRSNPVWDGYRTSNTFELNTNSISYNIYRIQILTTAGNSEMELGDVEFFATTSAIETPSLSYGTTSVALIANMDEKILQPTQNGFQSFTITPSPATDSGITFDTTSGSLKIVPTSMITLTQYQISAQHTSNSQTYTTTISISATECTSPSIRFNVIQYVSNSGTSGEPETVTIYNSGNTQIFTYSITPSDSESITKTHKFCQAVGTYTITLSSTSSDGFSISSYTSVVLYRTDGTSFTASRTNNIAKTSTSFKISLQYNTPSSIKVLANSATIPTGWYTSSFSDSTWTTYTRSSSLTSSTIFALYRASFTVSSTTDIQGWEINYRTNAGTIVYLDGTEIARFYIPTTGEISSSTTATGGSASYSWRTITGSMSQLAVGTHIFAIGTVASSSSYATDVLDFDIMLRFMADSNTNSRTWNMGSDQSSYVWSDCKADKLFDSNYNTRFATYFTSSYPAPQWGAGNINGWSFETFNMYCIVSGWDAPQHDPKSITLSASTIGWDESTFEVLDTQEGIVFDGRSQRLCFYMPSVTKAYNIFKISALETNVAPPDNDKFILAELEFYLVDFNKITVPAFALSSTSITGYVNSQITSVYPTSSYYRSFSITPTLPNGLSFAASTGTISGSPTAVSSGTYTISAVSITGTAVSMTVTINIQTCSLPNVFFKLYFSGMEGSDANQNGFTLANMAGVTIDSLTSFPSYLLTGLTRGYCQPSGAYILTLTDAYRDGWGDAMVTAYNEDESVIISTTLLSGESPKTVYINVGYLLRYGQTTWKYTTSAQTGSSWTTSTFSDSAWSSAVSGSFSGLSGTTVYYRGSFSVSSISTYALYEISLKIKAGIIAYLNGVEIYRYNLPTGNTVSSTTLANSEFSDVTTVTTSESAQFGNMIDGTNVLAVEIHRYSDVQETTFDAQIVLQLSGNNRVGGGVVTTNVAGYSSSSYTETEDKAFDGILTTKYYGKGCGQTVWLEYTYNYGRKEFVSSVSISRGNNVDRLPSQFMLSGSNDGINYVNLAADFNLQFGTYQTSAGTVTIPFFNKVAYNKYRVTLEMKECTAGIEVGEIELTASRIENYCAADGLYGETLSGQSGWRTCGQYYFGAYTRPCTSGVWGTETSLCIPTPPRSFNYTAKSYVFKTKRDNSTPAPTYQAAEVNFTVSPTLPSGLSINVNTGIISGKPQSDFSETDYTITISNISGSRTTTVTLSSIAATDLEGWAIALIVIACIVIVIFIAFIVFIVLNRRKGSKKGNHKVMKAGAKATTPTKATDKKVRI